MSELTNCFGTTTYQYDSFGNLNKVSFPNGKVIEYKVDAQNRRFKKTVNGQVQEYYIWYDQTRLAAVLDANKQPKEVYIYGAESANVPSYLVKDGKTYKIIHDPGMQSVRYVVDIQSVMIVQETEYDEYGNFMKNTNPNFQHLAFAGGLYDQDTKFLRFGARDYDPTTSRWTTKDPIGFAGGDTNLYAYVGGNPMSYVDPDGFSAQKTMKDQGGISPGPGGSSGGACPITGYTKHGINSAISRSDGGSMSPSTILNTVKNPTSITPNPSGGSIYTGPGGQVVLSPSGRVITVIPSGSKSFRGPIKDW